MPKTEVERWLEEIGPAFPTLEELYSEWTLGAHKKLEGQLHQARAAALLSRHYGEGSIEEFAARMNVAAPTVYRYAYLWRRLLEALGSEGEIYQRLEHSPLSISTIIEAARFPTEQVAKALDEAEDEGWSSRKTSAIRSERAEQSLREAQESFALETGKNAEVIELVECPECGAHFHINEANTWMGERGD
jgi:hypothetical protein